MTTLKAQRAAEVLANRKQAFAKRLATLTGHVAERTSKLEIDRAIHDGKTADELAAEISAREPVGRALHEQKAEAIKSAAKQAAVTIGWVQVQLEKAGWDITVAAPYPTSCWDSEYKSKQARHNLFTSLTDNVIEGYHHYRKGEAHLVKMSDKGIERFINNAERDAAIQYDAFICKMVKKVGPTAVDATIAGDHIWSHSILFVVHSDGRNEKWKTQQIWNTSIHGIQFPQWPSRIVK